MFQPRHHLHRSLVANESTSNVAIKSLILLSLSKIDRKCSMYLHTSTFSCHQFLAAYLLLMSRLRTCMQVSFTEWPKRNARGVTINYCFIVTKLEVFLRQVYHIFAGYARMREYCPIFEIARKKTYTRDAHETISCCIIIHLD